MADKCLAGQTYYWASLATSSTTANIIEQTNNRPRLDPLSHGRHLDLLPRTPVSNSRASAELSSSSTHWDRSKKAKRAP
jgi:hypothetical protein